LYFLKVKAGIEKDFIKEIDYYINTEHSVLGGKPKETIISSICEKSQIGNKPKQTTKLSVLKKQKWVEYRNKQIFYHFGKILSGFSLELD
jgi:hypothetical protein